MYNIDTGLHLRWLTVTHHVKLCLGNNSFQFLALFAINNTIHNHVNRAVHIFLKQFVENFLFLEEERQCEDVI